MHLLSTSEVDSVTSTMLRSSRCIADGSKEQVEPSAYRVPKIGPQDQYLGSGKGCLCICYALQPRPQRNALSKQESNESGEDEQLRFAASDTRSLKYTFVMFIDLICASRFH